MRLSENPDFALVSAAFPNIAKKIDLFWGYPELVDLMFDLQQDSSDRPRAGFPGDVLLALQSLEAAHDVEFPQLKRFIPSIWQTLR